MFRTALLTALATVLALPAPSLAKDPLLSGYAGPGGGEQVLLGSRLMGGGGSGTAAAPSGAGGAATATQGSLRAPAPAAVSGGAPSSSAPATSHRGPKSHASKGKASGGDARTATGTTATTATPRPIAYPTRADDAGGFPLSAGELLVGFLALAGIAGLAVWLRRIAPHGGGPGAQASA